MSKKKVVSKKIIKKKIPSNRKKKVIKKKQPSKKKSTKNNLQKKLSSNYNSYGIKDNNINYDSLVVSQKTVVQGKISSPKTVLVFGEVHGIIKSANVHLAKGSKTTGSIIAENIFIEGQCGAEIQVKKFCQIKSSAVIKGDIKYDDNISIDMGARILGQLLPKKKPLALPDYSGDHLPSYDEEEKKLDPILETKHEGPQLSVVKKKDDSFDKIIKKIFK